MKKTLFQFCFCVMTLLPLASASAEEGGGGGGSAADNRSGIVPWSSDECKIDDKFGGSEPIGYKVKCGIVGLNNIPQQIVLWISLLLNILPSIGVLMTLVASVYYLYGAASGETEKGKNALMYVVTGLIVTFASWWFVDWLQAFLTG